MASEIFFTSDHHFGHRGIIDKCQRPFFDVDDMDEGLIRMLSHPTIEQLGQLGQLGLAGMAEAFAEIEASSEVARLTHPEWLGLLIEREVTHRRDRRLAARLRYAKLRHQAVVEDVDDKAQRGLDRVLFQKLCGATSSRPTTISF